MNYVPICVGILVLFLFAGLFMKLTQNRKEGVQTFFAFLALGLGYLAYLGVGSLLLPARVHFDNGFGDRYDVVIDDKPPVPVLAYGLKVIELRPGEHSVVISRDGEPFETYQIRVRGKRDYIYNIGDFYEYELVTYTYYAPGHANAGLGYPTSQGLGSERFFEMPRADYGLDEKAPARIVVEGSQQSETRTDLERTER